MSYSEFHRKRGRHPRAFPVTAPAGLAAYGAGRGRSAPPFHVCWFANRDKAPAKPELLINSFQECDT